MSSSDNNTNEAALGLAELRSREQQSNKMKDINKLNLDYIEKKLLENISLIIENNINIILQDHEKTKKIIDNFFSNTEKIKRIIETNF